MSDSAPAEDVDLYIRTYSSLLRSSGDVPVRAFEEAHLYSGSVLHAGARDARPDVAAFAYSAARLPSVMIAVERLVLGHSHEQFEHVGLDVRRWEVVRTRGRRRPLRWGGEGTLAVFVSSTSDVDDLVPIVTAWQIEWNKMHEALRASALGRALAGDPPPVPSDDELAAALRLDAGGLATLKAAFDGVWREAIAAVARRPCSLTVRLLNGTWSQYQRSAQRWWSGIEPHYLRDDQPRRRPVYFMSSNTHALPNLIGGFARAHVDRIGAFVRDKNPEGLRAELDAAEAANDDGAVANLVYYLLRAWMRDDDSGARKAEVRAWDEASGLTTIPSPGRIDVDAQIVELSALRPDRLDPRLRVPGLEALAASDAVLINIDYPLGMAAYHHLARLAQGAGEIRGLYVMGKAATLNARVGDVLVSNEVLDLQTGNTWLFRNVFTAADFQPWLRRSSVLDNQKAVTVRGPFLQSRPMLDRFHRDGVTVLEMEAGPYLSAIHELVLPTRHPVGELVHLSNATPWDVGIVHYASDTPYSRRQSLLSKSLSAFGVESTYACAVAILRRVLEREIAAMGGR